MSKSLGIDSPFRGGRCQSPILVTCGNGRLRGSRNAMSEAVICAMLRDFREHGQRAIAKVRETQPGVYLKVLASPVPREHKVEHTNPLLHAER